MRGGHACIIPSYLHAGGRGRGGPTRSGSRPATPQRGGSTPRRGGKGRGRGSDTPRARPGFGASLGRNVSEAVRSNAPLSKLLYSERPFLKPIIFVPSVYTRTLFEEVEDILQPVAESAGLWIFSFVVNTLTSHECLSI